MEYTPEEVIQYVEEEDIKFIRLAFCDLFGRQKNISIMPPELPRAFKYGIAIDASAIHGFDEEIHSDLFLHPEANTLAPLPWRPEEGGVVRMFCSITYPDGQPFKNDTRYLLKTAIKKAKNAGLDFFFGTESEFYLFKLDQDGLPTHTPYDYAHYLDIAPDDKGENIRREICLTLEQMGIQPESSHHEEGPGQNEIDFRYSDPLTAADNAVTFQTIVKTVALRNGLVADFSPKPLDYFPGNGFHINMSVQSQNSTQDLNHLIAGILNRIPDMTLFLNPSEESYHRFGSCKAPAYISWSRQNRSQLIRVPAALDEYRRAELRSPDASTNVYLAFTLLIHAAIEGIQQKLPLQEPADFNLYAADHTLLSNYQPLPKNLTSACQSAKNSRFIKEILPESVIRSFCSLSF